MKNANNLFKTFTAPSRSAWEKVAISEVGEAKSIDPLLWKTDDMLSFSPFYSLENIQDLSYLERFTFPANAAIARHWNNMPEVKTLNAKSASTEALEHLRHEAEGIIFNIEGDSADFATLLKEIEWEHCQVSFIANANFPLAKLNDYLSLKKFDRKKIGGAIFWKDDETIPVLTEELGAIKDLGIWIKASSAVNEISNALIAGVNVIEKQLSGGGSVEKILNRIAFNIPVSAQLFIETAKMKALRNLWYQVAQSYGVKEYGLTDLHIHGRSEAIINEKFQPHGNMLKSTIAAIAAIGGGCNSITIQPEDVSNTVMQRIARNTSAILLNESHMGKVSDPFAGAYSIEMITDRLMKEAWEKFTSEI